MIKNKITGQRRLTFEDVTVKVFSPAQFNELLSGDFLPNLIAKSLDLKRNQSALLKAGLADGGRGGEFFFFSEDNRLILKSMKESERDLLLSILPEYIEHYERNPHSLIAKVLGVFELFLMQNTLMGIPKSQVLATYDLKGSTVAREVMKKGDDVNKVLKEGKVLKDLDFSKIEGSIYVSPEDREALVQGVTMDTDFFKRHCLIDYSLLLTKINPSESIKNPKFIQSEKPGEEEIYFSLGIIDYLQLYNTKKKLEKQIKVITALDADVNISIQEPPKYADRFRDMLYRITTPVRSSTTSRKSTENLEQRPAPALPNPVSGSPKIAEIVPNNS
eukprot:TRINITY_DN2521_c0_g1_i9.p1 TRINITY_DN2521_c0_g1~~TRINITY_DN2521_c0_g1_i9.p1  ORF type:complete len:332 (-),score=86.95 TRINITY_DN2521_c0_g1_i9:230-1225(-)